MASSVINLEVDRVFKAHELHAGIPITHDEETDTFHLMQSSQGLVKVAQYVWDTATLAWIKQSGGGGGGPSSDVNVLNFPATQTVNDGGGSLTVNGEVSLTEFPAASALGDADANPTTTRVGAHLMAWDNAGSTWERVRASPTNADGLTGHVQGGLDVMGHMYGYNGTNWDRLRATIANGLAVDVTRVQGSVAVTGPLTDTQLRATPVPVSGTVTANAGTGTFAVAGTVAVSNFPVTQAVFGTVAVSNFPATQAVTQSGAWTVAGSGTFTVSGTVAISGSVAVTGPLTDAQLRATAVPVSLTSTTVTNTVAVSGPLTDAQLRATPVPTSITKTALTGSAPTSASVGVASASVLAANASRRGLVLTNLSTGNISFGLGAAAVLNNGITLTPNGVWVMDEYTFSTQQIFAIAAGAASQLGIQEFQ